ncbi:MAG: DNA adenine methylase [Deltaproteobacteria bacterium]
MKQINLPLNLIELEKVKTYEPRVKPFVKWAGGKTQLLGQIAGVFPAALKSGVIKKYAEPFVGSGAVFFHIIQNYHVKKSFISDSSQELILTYLAVQRRVESVIDHLEAIERDYHKLSYERQRNFFYGVRSDFNRNMAEIDSLEPNVEQAARFIFLNRTCYNGLFRVNSKGAFNVPFGSYKNPQICFPKTLRDAAQALQNVEIHCGDFTLCRGFVDSDSFVYFDPPYRPISQTSSFNSYQRIDFGDRSQIRLADFFRELHQTEAKLMLSNSDQQNREGNSNFFETVYSGFKIHRVLASRMINSNGGKRGKITELLITNYET